MCLYAYVFYIPMCVYSVMNLYYVPSRNKKPIRNQKVRFQFTCFVILNMKQLMLIIIIFFIYSTKTWWIWSQNIKRLKFTKSLRIDRLKLTIMCKWNVYIYLYLYIYIFIFMFQVNKQLFLLSKKPVQSCSEWRCINVEYNWNILIL